MTHTVYFQSDFGRRQVGCKACKNLRGQHPVRAENVRNVSRKSPLGWVNMSAYNFFVSRPKFTNFFAHRGRDVLAQVLSGFSLCRSVTAIFVISRKLSKIAPKFGLFLFFQILLGAGLPSPKSHTLVITHASLHVTWKVSSGYSRYSQSYRHS